MRYDGTYAKSVSDSIVLSKMNLLKCKADTAEIPSIPSDFERSQDINNVITGINNIKLDDINSEIESLIESFEGKEAENQALAILLKMPFGSEFQKRRNEYLNSIQFQSKDEILQAYINGKISLAEYSYYIWIWDLSPEELAKLSKTLSKEEKNEIFRVRNGEKQKNESEKKLKAILYGLGLTPSAEHLSRVDWAIKYTNRDDKYGIDQGMYRKHMWYETPDGTQIKRNSDAYKEAVDKGIKLTPKHDSFIDEKIKFICEKYPMFSEKDALEILEIIDTNGGMCSIASMAEAIAYQYADKPAKFEKQFGFPLYDENHNLNDEIYIDFYIHSNMEVWLGVSEKDNFFEKVLNEWIEDFTPGLLSNRYIKKDYGGMHSAKKQVPVQTNLDTDYIAEKYGSSNSYEMQVDSIYFNSDNSYETGNNDGNINEVKEALDENKSVILYFWPDSDTGVPMIDEEGNITYCGGGHAVNVIDVNCNDVYREIYISTWGKIYKIDLESLIENTDEFDFSSCELVGKS